MKRRERSSVMEKTFETPGPVRLSVEVPAGAVSVVAQPSAVTEVSLEAESAGAEALVSRARVEHRDAAGGGVVVVKLPRQRGLRAMRGNPVRVRVAVPEGSDVRVVTASAGVDVAGTIGGAEVVTASGDASLGDVGADIVVQSVSGHVTAGTVRGSVQVHSVTGGFRCQRALGRVGFSTTSGDLHIGRAEDRVEVKATSGHVKVGRLGRGARIANVSGDVRVQAVDRGDVHVRSVSGDVFVGVERDVDLHVDVQSVSGLVHSEIPLDATPGPSRREAQVNVSVRSVSGDVEIARALGTAA
jgi:hypothetical protein